VTSPSGGSVQTVLLAEPRGFCAGVEMAIKALAWMVRAFEPPVYCYHEIVHNRLVVDRFREQGVVFVDDIAEVPPGAPLMLSAHGSAPEVVAAARADGRYVVNAVCPLVTKVHVEVDKLARKAGAESLEACKICLKPLLRYQMLKYVCRNISSKLLTNLAGQSNVYATEDAGVFDRFKCL